MEFAVIWHHWYTSNKTRMSADQHKCLLHLAYINPTLLYKKKLTNSKNDPEIWKKDFHMFVELVETNPLMYNNIALWSIFMPRNSFEYFRPLIQKRIWILKKLSIK